MGFKDICPVVKLTKDKIPDWNDAYLYDDVKDSPGLAFFLIEPYILLDYDSDEAFNFVLNVLEKENKRTYAYRSIHHHGGHFIFTSPISFKNQNGNETNTANQDLLLGAVDIKCWGYTDKGNPKHSPAIFKIDNQEKEVIWDINPISLPFWLRPIYGFGYHKKDNYWLTRADFQKSSRNSSFFKLKNFLNLKIKPLPTQQQLMEVAEIYNRYIVDIPLSNVELRAVMNNEYALNNQQGGFYDLNNKFQHLEAAKYLLDNFHFKLYRERYWYWLNQRWNEDDKDNHFIISLIESECHPATNHQTNEVMGAIKRRVGKDLFNLNHPIPYFNFKNMTLNGETLELIPKTYHLFTPYESNVEYDKDFDEKYPQLALKYQGYLKGIFRSNMARLDQFYKIVGYGFVPSQISKKAFYFYGETNSGKSTANDFITLVFGGYNSSMTLKKASQPESFNGQLLHSIFNINGDDATKWLNQLGFLKTWTGGDPLDINEKFKVSLTVAIRSKLISISNNPTGFDLTDKAWNDRLYILFFTEKLMDKSVRSIIKKEWQTAGTWFLNQIYWKVKELREIDHFEFKQLDPDLRIDYIDSFDDIGRWMKEDTFGGVPLSAHHFFKWTKGLMYELFLTWLATEKGIDKKDIRKHAPEPNKVHERVCEKFHLVLGKSTTKGKSKGRFYKLKGE